MIERRSKSVIIKLVIIGRLKIYGQCLKMVEVSKMKLKVDKLVLRIESLITVFVICMLLGACSSEREEVSVEADYVTVGGEDVVAEQAVSDPDDLSQAIHYQGFLDESLYTMWNTDWNDCDFDGDGIKDRIYREINDSETEITYRIDFGNGEEFEIAKTGDYFMYPQILVADICGDANNELLFIGEHTASTMPHADVMLYEKTEESYKEISLIYPKEWFGDNDGTVYMYSGDEQITDALGPTADFVEQFDWNFWCENEAWEQLHFGTKEECGGTVSGAEFIDFNDRQCVIVYFNIGDKWVYKEIGLVYCIEESERKVVLKKIVADGLRYGDIYANMSWLGEPVSIMPVENQSVINNKGFYVGVDYTGLEVTMKSDDDFRLMPSSAIYAITITGKDVMALGFYPVGTSKLKLQQVYQLKEDDFLEKNKNFSDSDERVETYRIEYDGIRKHNIPEYDSFCIIHEPDNPVALIYLLKEEMVKAVLVRHLTAD